MPHRGDLGSEGEINYKYVLNVLKEAGYDGIVGLEYLPAGACYVHLARSTHVLDVIGNYNTSIQPVVT